MPSASVDLIFTSPPYFNTKEYATYPTYEDYLRQMERIFQQCHRVLREGRFFAVNSSPVLIPREKRTQQSRRLPIPFDLHGRITNVNFDFVDDIVWEKPEGAGWVSGRGRRFSADRTPLQYKTVPVTEYVMVYRKHTDKLIDWNIAQHNPQLVEESKITGTYDVTNVWKFAPAHDKRHPAVFPLDLAERIIRYYSFKGDLILDPFAGLGTTGKAALASGRAFYMIEKEREYVEAMRSDLAGDLTDPVDFTEHAA
jgi:DNA modification methylase